MDFFSSLKNDGEDQNHGCSCYTRQSEVAGYLLVMLEFVYCALLYMAHGWHLGLPATPVVLNCTVFLIKNQGMLPHKKIIVTSGTIC